MLYMHFYCFFFFNDTATTEIYTLSLHDALPIYSQEDDAPSGSMTASRSTSRSGRRNTCSSDRARRFTRTSLYSHRVPGGRGGRRPPLSAQPSSPLPAARVWSVRAGVVPKLARPSPLLS